MTHTPRSDSELLADKEAQASTTLVDELVAALQGLVDRGGDLGDHYYSKCDDNGYLGNNKLFENAEAALKKAKGIKS